MEHDANWLRDAEGQPLSLRLGETTRIKSPGFCATVCSHVFQDGLSLYETEINTDEPVSITPRPVVDRPFVATQMTLRGHGNLFLPDGQIQRLESNEAAIFRARADGTVYKLPGRQAVSLFGVAAPVETLAHWFGGQIPEEFRPFLADGASTTVVSLPAGAVMREITAMSAANSVHGPLRSLVLETMAMRVMAILLDGLCGGPYPQVDDLSAREVRAAQEARARLFADMCNPPKTGELAIAVGLSSQRLEQAFRVLYGASVFGALRRERLNHARQVLAAGEARVSDIAWRVGYTHVGNFTRAFQAHFGVLPSSFDRDRKRR